MSKDYDSYIDDSGQRMYIVDVSPADPEDVVGSDGLTESQREELAAQYRERVERELSSEEKAARKAWLAEGHRS